jgi:hypothetical protein
MKLSFHGAARPVTGGRYMLEVSGFKLLLDCGLFQEPAALRIISTLGSRRSERGCLCGLSSRTFHLQETCRRMERLRACNPAKPQ